MIEYTTEVVDNEGHLMLREQLNKLGEHGWRLCNAFPIGAPGKDGVAPRLSLVLWRYKMRTVQGGVRGGYGGTN